MVGQIVRSKTDVLAQFDPRRQAAIEAGTSMSAVILRFPFRTVRVEPERDGEGWLVVAGSHAWLHGGFGGALQDAFELARCYGVAVVSGAGRFVP